MAETEVNATATALLGLLHDGPMTGGQLMAAAQKRLGAFWSMTRSQVYRELPALAESGYVKLGKPGARSSQPYSITPAGKKAFARWLAEEPARMQGWAMRTHSPQAAWGDETRSRTSRVPQT